MKLLLIFATVFIFFSSCTNKSIHPSIPPEVIPKQIDSFFPVTSFIKGQMAMLDSLPVTPLLLTIIKGKTDSTWLSKQELKSLLSSFLNPAITETNFTKLFTEIKFKDETLHAITFTYDPINILPDTVALQHWDVYVNPETGNVVKIYLVKKVKKDNKIYTSQLTWKTNQLAKITTLISNSSGAAKLVKEDVFIWDFSARY